MDANLVIDDFYVTRTVGYCYCGIGRNLNEELNRYIEVLQSIKNDAIKDGSVSEALNKYIDCVNLIKQELIEISKLLETTTEGFIVDIDEADQYLF